MQANNPRFSKLNRSGFFCPHIFLSNLGQNGLTNRSVVHRNEVLDNPVMRFQNCFSVSFWLQLQHIGKQSENEEGFQSVRS